MRQLDQAAALRSLLLDQDDHVPPAAATIAVAGVKGGVGTTTLALNLAVALGVHGNTIELVDWRDVDEARTQEGPAGLRVRSPCRWRHVLCGRRALACPNRPSTPDWRVIDFGCQIGDGFRNVRMTIDRLVLAATPAPAALLAAMDTLRELLQFGRLSPEFVVLSHDAADGVAGTMARLQATLCRFLPRVVAAFVAIPYDAAVHAASHSGRPAVLDSPDSPFSRAVQELAARLSAAPLGRAAPAAANPRYEQSASLRSDAIATTATVPFKIRSPSAD